MAHFYLSPHADSATVGESLTVTGAEARHATTVGRLAAGERIRVGDGMGRVALGTVTSADRDHFTVQVESVSVQEPPQPQVWLAQALAKGDRDELAIQAATELGVDGVIPWAAERSIVKWTPAKSARHQQRWASILREASKQSLRARIPALGPPAATAELAGQAKHFHLLVLDPDAPESLSSFTPDARDLLLLVGPEGGVSPAELSALSQAGASRAALGAGILRTSTAGPAAISVLNVALGRW